MFVANTEDEEILKNRLEPPVTGEETSGHENMDAKKLRSPTVKRHLSAPVALQGWLFKQGSDGFMLWRRRWFVLSEYCLFYYKSSEEDKVLGSILLPSYKVSPCTSDDRVFRKFAFKLEHVNMRTYYLAAETRELMVRWMNALSLASILHDISNTGSYSNQPSMSSVSSVPGVEGVVPDAANRSVKHVTVPAVTWVTHHQPTQSAPQVPPHRVVDAAPRPGPSPAWRPANTLLHPHPVVMHAWPAPQSWSGHCAVAAQQPLYANAPPKPRRLSPEPLERRTPDAYGRSTPRNNATDYEDVYAHEQMKHIPSGAGVSCTFPPIVMHRHPRRPPPRPHSADFLDHEVRYAPPPRPKSSLGDVDWWSEEAYAQQMRQSALFVAPQSEEFVRSASVRLPRQVTPDNHKSQQREESIQRLLEWKQRMLQSPLTRKPTQPARRKPMSITQQTESMRYNSFSSDDEASVSGSLVGREALPPRAVSVPLLQSPMVEEPNQLELSIENQDQSLNLSAGELLGRTHEELVLLLIQLRRQSAGVCKAMETCHTEIESQARLAELETPHQLEHLRKLDELKKHLLKLEKQYEKGRPLVNLVDNMVKLGSLYCEAPCKNDRLQFNHRVQEQRLLAEERREWDRLSPDKSQLQMKVQELYRLDRLLQEESGTLQNLQQDKELLERALTSLRQRLQDAEVNSAEVGRYQKQQQVLERELSRVRLLLAHNSKKLEETVAENTRLEQELVVLRQKLKHNSLPSQEDTRGALETELCRIHDLVRDLQRQRQQLSHQVKQLIHLRPGPTGVAGRNMGHFYGAGPVPGRKRQHSTWLETDLDLLVTVDLAIATPPHSPVYMNSNPIVYTGGGTCEAKENVPPQELQHEYFPPPPPVPVISSAEDSNQYCQVDISEADDRMKRYYGIIPREKQQEIKTVRIVKRESERRQRDRDRSGNIGIPISNGFSGRRIMIIEDNELSSRLQNSQFQRSLSLPRAFGKKDQLPSQCSTVPPNRGHVSALQDFLLNPKGTQNENDTSPQLSPVFKSEAAKAIVQEIAACKRPYPKEHRRHHTVSSDSIQTAISIMDAARSRDDLDMEQVLRPRFNAPDVVRSTLHKDFKYNENTIDSVLGIPNKIVIPERYVPEQPPELSAEEQLRRLKKAESIRKMLSETTAISAPARKVDFTEEKQTLTLKKKLAAEKKQREHLLQLNQLLAQQVMEKSKLVAGTNSAYHQDQNV